MFNGLGGASKAIQERVIECAAGWRLGSNTANVRFPESSRPESTYRGRADVRFWPKADTRGRLLGPKFGYPEVFRRLSVRYRPKADIRVQQLNLPALINLATAQGFANPSGLRRTIGASPYRGKAPCH